METAFLVVQILWFILCFGFVAAVLVKIMTGSEKAALFSVLLFIGFIVVHLAMIIVELATGRTERAIVDIILLVFWIWLVFRKRGNGRRKNAFKLVGEKSRAARKKLLDALTPPQALPSPA